MKVYSILPFALIVLTACAQREFDRRAQLGSDALSAGALKEAVEQFTLAVKSRPDAETGHLGLGVAYLYQYSPFDKSSNPPEVAKNAEAEFRRVLEINPKSARAMECLASLAYQQIYVKAGEGFRPYLDVDSTKMDEARSWFEKAVTADPADPVAHYGLGALDWERAETVRNTRLAELKIDPWVHAIPLKVAGLRDKNAPLYESTIKEMEAVLKNDQGLLEPKRFTAAALARQLEVAENPADVVRLNKECNAMADELFKESDNRHHTPVARYPGLRVDLPIVFAEIPKPPAPPAPK